LPKFVGLNEKYRFNFLVNSTSKKYFL